MAIWRCSASARTRARSRAAIAEAPRPRRGRCLHAAVRQHTSPFRSQPVRRRPCPALGATCSVGIPMGGDGEIDAAFRQRYETDLPTLGALIDAPGLNPGEREALELLATVYEKGLCRILERRPKSRDRVELLINAFITDGPVAVLNVGSQRGGDFLTNQLRGRWAEQVVTSMIVRGTTIVPFGPSGAAMPGEQDHRQVVAAFRQIHLLEGKRPDLLAFDTEKWNSLPPGWRDGARTWPDRLLSADDEACVRRGRCGIEVKNSTWHYGKRRAAGGGRLSITVKEEELAHLTGWSKKTGLPVLFVQVLFDEVYCMSFRRMIESIERGHVYEPGDYLFDRTSGAGGKTFHRFFIDGSPHLCARVAFPAESLAHVRVLDDGNVVPYIDFRPARAEEVDSEAFDREVAYAG